jgi:superfamily I DNA/RNA helicase
MAQLVRHVTHDQVHKTFAPFSHVQYGETTQSGNHDFQIEFYHDYLDEGTKKKLKTLQIEPKTLWTSIRVIKSHTRCSVTKEHLSREEFMALPKSYGLTNDQRHLTYDMYLIYQDWLIDGEFKWDEADRVMYIAKNGESVFADQEFVSWQKRAFERGEENLVDTEDNPLFPFFHLVFVDEAQDFSDFDISLLLRMSGGVRSLFLAGDPAQSVEIGLKMRVGTVNNVIHSCLPLDQHKSIQVSFLIIFPLYDLFILVQ